MTQLTWLPTQRIRVKSQNVHQGKTKETMTSHAIIDQDVGHAAAPLHWRLFCVCFEKHTVTLNNTRLMKEDL